ncbi:MAG: STAS/SEC14 domain-containing protein [Burkholderiales bacterium]
MAYQTRAHDDPRYVEIRYSGEVTPAEMRCAARAILALADRHGTYRVLADCAELSGGHSIIDLHDVADWLAADPARATLREAVVLPDAPEPNRKLAFWEMACVNRGLDVRAFASYREAVLWLCS